MIRSLGFALVGLVPAILASACGDGEGTKTRVTRSTGGSAGAVTGESGAPAAGRSSTTAAGGTGGTTARGEAGATANEAGTGGAAETGGGAGGSASTAGAGSPAGGEAGEGSAGTPEPAAGSGGSGGRGGAPAAGNGGTAGAAGSTGSNEVSACAHPYGNYCEEYLGPSEYVDEFDYNCSFSEQNSVDACPVDFQGLCTVVQEVFTFRHFYYQLDTDELAAAEESCAGDAGTWMTP